MPSVTVLTYHHIKTQPDAHTVTSGNFRDHLEWLIKSKRRILNAAEFIAWKEKKIELDRPSVLLTFDDGWIDNWQHALPILKQYRVPAVFFIVTSWPGNGPIRSAEALSGLPAFNHYKAMEEVHDPAQIDGLVMRWSELKAAHDTGSISLQSHSHTHGDWWGHKGSWCYRLAALRDDLLESKRTMKEKLGVEPDQLCWPRGVFTVEMMQIAQQSGFRAQYSVLRGYNQPLEHRVVRRLNMEDKSADWLSTKIARYERPLVSQLLGFGHQWLHCARMLRGNEVGFKGGFSSLPVHRLV